MQYVFHTFLIFLFAIGQVSAQANLKLSGKFPKEITGHVQVIIDRSFLDRSREINTVSINEGQFEFSTVISRGFVIDVKSPIQTTSLYVEPGDELMIDFTTRIDDPAKGLSGKGAAQNRFLMEFREKFAADFNDSLNAALMKSMTVDAFETMLFGKRKAQLDFVKADPARDSYSKDFNDFIQNEINYRYWKELLAHPIVNANSDQKILTVNPLPQVMLDDFEKVKISNKAALVSQSYREFIRYFVIYFGSKANGFKKFTDYTTSADRKMAVAREKLDDDIYLYWLSRFTIDECANLSGFMIKKLTDSIKDLDKEKTVTGVVTQVVAATPRKAEPSGSQQAAGINFNGDPGLTDLKGKPASLSDFKGKVVYIDFWASWCGPCRKMMPYSRQMHDQLTPKQKKDIVFLYISIDADTASWKKAMRDLDMVGEQFISPGNWKSKACQYFQIGSIPRYMIMNKKGEIVDINAKRPADPAVLQELIRLSEEK